MTALGPGAPRPGLPRLGPSRLGLPRLHLRSTDSTNERARALALAGAPHGTLVTAAAQSAGRGRQGRQWSAPAGSSLLMSLVLRGIPRLTPLIAAVACCDALEQEGRRALVKWPNDIVLADGERLAKVAGILVEGRPQQGWAVLGMGVNVAVGLDELPPELRETAATLGLPREAVERVLRSVLSALEVRLGEAPESVLSAWSRRDALRGRSVAWGTTAGAGGHGGIAQGIDGDGRLVVALAGGGRTALESGEVHLTPPD